MVDGEIARGVLRVREGTPDRDVQGIYSLMFEPSADLDCIHQGVALLLPRKVCVILVGMIDPHLNMVMISSYLPYSPNDLHQEPCTVLKRPSIFIFAVVNPGAEKLVD